MVDQQQDLPKVHSLKSEIMEWIKAILIATVVVLVIRWFLFTPTIVSGHSMEPNFQDKERIIVNKIIYTFREPKYGEVIVFHAPEERDYIKRVIALPGDRVKVIGDEVYVNDKIINEPYIQEQVDEAKSKGTSYNRMVNFKVEENGINAAVVPEDTVFVLGDNRSNSKDSRYEDVGFIPLDKIVGRADLVFWPLSEIEIIDHPDGVIK